MKVQTKIAIIIDAFTAEITRFSRRQKTAFCLLSLLGASFLYFVFLLTLKYSVDFTVDECFYLSTCERLLRGDKLILHDWLLPQFVSLFQIFPYSIFKRITGSSESVILFMRYLTAGVTFLNYCYILYKHKKRPWIALSTAFLFCSFVPLGSFFLGYYTLPPIFLFTIASVIIDEEAKHRNLRLVFSGVLLSAAVILVPGLAVAWALYFVFVVIRFAAKKKNASLFSEYDFVLDIGTFKYLLLGVLLSAGALLVYLQISCGLNNIIEMLPNVHVHTEYSDFNKTAFYKHDGFSTFLKVYWPEMILFFIETVLAFVFRCFGQKHKSAFEIKNVLLLLNCLALGFSLIAPFRRLIMLMGPPVFIAWFGLNCLILCRQRNPKMLFFWILGAAQSFAQDLTSEITCGFGFIVSVFPTIVILCQLVNELRNDALTVTAKNNPGDKKKTSAKAAARAGRRHTAVAGAVGIVAFVLFLSWSLTNMVSYTYIFHSLPKEIGKAEVTKGPHKGVILPENYKELYDDVLSDLDRCMEITDQPIYIMGNYPFAYLYLDRDIHVAATFNALEQMNQTYWEVYPERKPAYIYIPIKEEESSINISQEEFNKMPETQFVSYERFEGDAIKGKTGLIVHVTKWHV